MHVLGKAKAPADPKKPGKTKVTKQTAKAPEQPRTRPADEPQQPADALDAFEAMCNEQDPARAIMMLFWKARHQNPQFSIDITDKDLVAFDQCMEYLEVEPQIRVFRPQGMPPHPGAPATESRSAIPPRPAGPPKPYVVIQMVDKNGDAIVPIENNEEDLQRSQAAQRIRNVAKGASQLADQLMADLRANVTSSSTITEAANALKMLAQS
jgi:hypothetical protein